LGKHSVIFAKKTQTKLLDVNVSGIFLLRYDVVMCSEPEFLVGHRQQN
jgi:hypothetical protein